MNLIQFKSLSAMLFLQQWFIKQQQHSGKPPTSTVTFKKYMLCISDLWLTSYFSRYCIGQQNRRKNVVQRGMSKDLEPITMKNNTN